MSSKRQTKADVVVDFRRTQILDAARQSFVKRGVAATTVDAVAKAAGVAKGTVYLYFDSKDAILRDILTQDLQEFHDCTVPVIRRAGPPRARVEAYFRAALEFFERKRDFFEHCHLEMTPTVRQKAKSELGLVFAAQAEAWRDALSGTPAAAAGDRRRGPQPGDRQPRARPGAATSSRLADCVHRRHRGGGQPPRAERSHPRMMRRIVTFAGLTMIAAATAAAQTPPDGPTVPAALKIRGSVPAPIRRPRNRRRCSSRSPMPSPGVSTSTSRSSFRSRCATRSRASASRR